MSRLPTAATDGNAPSGVNVPAYATSTRLGAVESLRGLVIVSMRLDHVRETFFLHQQATDPMVVAETPPDLFFGRLLAHLCAPVFKAPAGPTSSV